jgi:hypothetical protein
MEFSNIEKAAVTVTSAGFISGFEFRENEIIVQGIGAVDRSRFIGNLSFVLDRPGFNFRADYGEGIPPNIVLNVNNVEITFAKGFSISDSMNTILIVGKDSVIWYEGNSKPRVIVVQGNNVSVMQVSVTETASATLGRVGISAIQIIVITFLGLILIGVVIFAGFLLRKRKMKRLMEYDKFPDVEGYELKM